MNKKHHRIAADVKADILRRVKEEGISVAQAAKDHGISEGTIYGWMVKGATGAPSWAEFSRLQKQNKELLELVGEITLKLSMTQKTIERRKKQISACPSPWHIPREPVLRPKNEGEGLAPQGPPGRRAADPSLLRLPANCYGTGTLPPAGAEGHASVWHQALPQERQKMEKIQGFPDLSKRRSKNRPGSAA